MLKSTISSRNGLRGKKKDVWIIGWDRKMDQLELLSLILSLRIYALMCRGTVFFMKFAIRSRIHLFVVGRSLEIFTQKIFSIYKQY